MLSHPDRNSFYFHVQTVLFLPVGFAPVRLRYPTLSPAFARPIPVKRFTIAEMRRILILDFKVPYEALQSRETTRNGGFSSLKKPPFREIFHHFLKQNFKTCIAIQT
jgi:hypothetical protein